MIPKVSSGRRVRGLLEYLWGRGKSDEHRDPHIVAGYDDPEVLAPPQHGDAWVLGGLAARLDAPQLAAGARGMRRYVWQCSLSLPPQEGPLSDEQWGRIATDFVTRMGFAGSGEQAGCRWIAVRHGPSKNQNDHVHLVVTLATEDGAPVWLRGDKRRSQQVCDALEDAHGLGKWGVRRDGAVKRPQVSRAEIERAYRSARPVERERARRAVRAALAGARDEASFVARMRAGGLQVAASPRGGARVPARGYSVSLDPPAGGEREWFAGRTLDGELSLVRVRQRWTGAALSVEQWSGERVPQRVLDAAMRMEVWRRSAAALDDITTRIGQLSMDSPQWPAVAQGTADMLARVAITAEPDQIGPISKAADILARAAAPRRTDPPAEHSPLGAELGRVADGLLVAGAARNSGEMTVVMTVVVSAARLVVALGELRKAQDALQAAGAAQAAAVRLMPVLAAHGVVAGPGPAKTGRAEVLGRDTVRGAVIDRGHGAAGADRDLGR